MVWSNPFLFELTIPAGAGTGARIEINKNNNGRIDIYNASNQLVDSMGGPAGKLVIGVPGGISGHFEFDPTQGLFGAFDQSGVEVWEMISADGSMRFNNTASEQVLFIGSDTGIIAQTAPDGSKILEISGQDIYWIHSPYEAAPFRWASITSAVAGIFTLISGGTATAEARSQIDMRSGDASQPTGSLTAPTVQIKHSQNTSSVDLLISGNLIATNASGVRFAWTTPTFATGWAEYAGGAYPPLRWRYDCEDNVHVTGCFTVTSLPAPNVLATGFPNSLGSDVNVTGAMLKISGPGTGLDVITSYIDNAGGLRMSSVTGVAVGDYFMINAVAPLRQI